MIVNALSPSPFWQSLPSVCNRVDIDFCRVHFGNQRHDPELTDWLKIQTVARVHFCNHGGCGLCSPSVADRLKHPVSFDFYWITMPIGLPVSGVVQCPFFPAQPLVGLVVRIGFHSHSLPGGFPGTLAFGQVAVILLPISWDEHRRAMETQYRFHSSSPDWRSVWDNRIRGTIWNFRISRELYVGWQVGADDFGGNYSRWNWLGIKSAVTEDGQYGETVIDDTRHKNSVL